MEGLTNKQTGTLLISLDFELFWGIADISQNDEDKVMIENVYSVVPRLLQLFEDHHIHATWATVGALMCNNENTFSEYLPSPYAPQTENLLQKLGLIGDRPESPCPKSILFAPGLVDMVSKSKGQEIGTHTYSHYYCDDPSSDPKQFAAELSASESVAAIKGWKIRSAVFPRNQVSKSFVEEIERSSLVCYRGVESGWITKAKKKWGMLGIFLWYLDNYIPLQKTCSYKISDFKDSEGTINLRNSRFFKPYRPKYRIIEKLKLWRYKMEMKFAAIHGEIYHMYWHPHNFAENTEINFEQMEELLSYFDSLSKKYGMKSRNMYEVYLDIQNMGNKT